MCLWDIRWTEPLRTIQAHQGGMAQMAVHEHAPVFATCVPHSFPLFPPSFGVVGLTLAGLAARRSSASNVVKVWNMNGEDEPISQFRNSCASSFPLSRFLLPLPLLTQRAPSLAAGFMGQKQAPMNSMAFHPHHMVLGCASGEQIDVFQMSRYNDWMATTTPLTATRFGQ